MPFSTSGIEVFFYTMAATAFVLAVLYVLRRRRTNFHYQAAHNLDEEEISFGTEMTKRTGNGSSGSKQSSRTQHGGEQKQRDELFDDDRSSEAAVDDIEFDRDELDQLRMLSSVRAANNRALSQSAAALIDDSDNSDDEEKKHVVIDMPTARLPAVSQPTQPPLPSPHRLQHRQSASMQHSGGGGGQQQVDRAGKDEKEERKEADPTTGRLSDRHERAVV